jgi:hypothetical protein
MVMLSGSGNLTRYANGDAEGDIVAFRRYENLLCGHSRYAR